MTTVPFFSYQTPSLLLISRFDEASACPAFPCAVPLQPPPPPHHIPSSNLPLPPFFGRASTVSLEIERPRLTMRDVVFLLFCICFAAAGAQSQYGCVIDAGSTGSRILVYRWDRRAFPDAPPPITTPIQIVAYSPARDVQTRVDTAEGRQGLKLLLEYARAQLAGLGLSVDTIAATPLFLKATAGMRVLTEEARGLAMADVRRILSSGPFQFKSEWARTISGEEEGVAGWIAVNYNAGLLPGQSSATGTTIGALDLGGASAQITFVPPSGVDILSAQFDLRLTVAARVSLYTHSFLYYGINEAVRRINELVVVSSGLLAGATIPHPCYLAGTPGGVAFDSLIAGGQVNFSGTSNWTACKEFVAPLMLRAAQCLTDPKPTSWPRNAAAAALLQRVAPLPVINPVSPGSTCSIGGQYQPPPTPVRFSAFSSFSFLYEALGVAYAAPLSDLRSSSASFCSLGYSAARQAFPTAASFSPFSELCLRAVYAQTLLVEGYGLDETTAGVVTVVPSQPGLSFAMGSMIFEANGLPFSVLAAKDQTTAVIALAVTLGLVLLGCAAAAACVWRRWPRRKQGILL
jgi:apyrase